MLSSLVEEVVALEIMVLVAVLVDIKLALLQFRDHPQQLFKLVLVVL